ncbi:MAG: MBOAT family protein [Desulfobacteraceae bacterium]|nr:MAG: MBOAT family protein [Desulfobacteraceae bacterium]
MIFHSLPFAVFFLITIGIYYSIPQRFRWIMVLGASYYFYMCWKPEYIFLLFGSTLVNYLTGLRMSVISEPRKRKHYLWFSIFFNLGMLFFFKYFNFLSNTVTELFRACNIFHDLPLFHVLLPIGISFYTFQALAYSIDVYKGHTRAERHLGIFALFLAFWPQLLAGPINRAHLLMPQLRKEHPFHYQRVTDGLRLMLWGLIKKVMIADHLAVYVNRVYNHIDDYQGIPLMIATVFYTVQIYCDFSGYTDMARGAARVMGYDLMENFNRPYFSKSFREFWQRWHISLSTWFRDYLYIPLGGNRVAEWRWHGNLFITFVLSGLWHGANWTFVIWGALHGCFLILENMTGNFQKRLADILFPDTASKWNHAVQTGITMSMVCLAWVFFRADSITDAFSILRKMFLIDPGQTGIDVVDGYSLLFMIFMILMLFVVELSEGKEKIHKAVGRLSLPVRWAIYTGFFWAVLIMSIFGVKQEFIYFQF